MMLAASGVVLMAMLSGAPGRVQPPQPLMVTPCPDEPDVLCRLVDGRTHRLTPRPVTPALPSPPGCVEDERDTVCGYGCIKNYGQLACAATPQGVCAATDGKVMCWDPPAAYLAYFAGEVPPPACVVNYGKVACGYGCVEHDGQVACASTAMGRCIGNYGKVTCFDPSAALLPLFKGKVPHAECLDGYGQLACGYHCVAQSGQVRCATTPQGSCTTKAGKVLCFDPPVSELAFTAAQGRELPPSRCVEEQGAVACGYHCLTYEGRVGCAQTPRGSCTITADGRVLCLDPPVVP